MYKEKSQVVNWVLEMQHIGLSISFEQLRFKIVKIT
jgi:hypothetical protein